MRKRLTVSILAVAVVILAITSFFLLENKFSAFKAEDNTWKLNLENFATAVAYDNGKVFVTDNPGNVECLDASSGSAIWTANVGGWTANEHLIAVNNGVVYVGAGGGVVDTLSESSGKLLPLSFAAPATTSWGMKQAPQQFFVSDGRIFVLQNGWGVFYVSNGEMFWESGEFGLKVGNATYSAIDMNPVFIQRTTRFNPNNGSTIWQVNGDASDPAVVVQDKVILWNYNLNGSTDDGHVMVCVNAQTGEIIWSFDVISRMYQPTVYNGLVLFGAFDGNFYELHLSDGSLAWKTQVTDQKSEQTLSGQDIHYPLTPSVSLVQVDQKNNRAFWAFTFAQEGWGGTDQYAGVIFGLDLANGRVTWKTPISQNISISSSGNIVTHELGLTLLNDKIFLTSGSDLLIFDQSSGVIDGTQHFDHYVLAPVADEEQVFVAGDLILSSYK